MFVATLPIGRKFQALLDRRPIFWTAWRIYQVSPRNSAFPAGLLAWDDPRREAPAHHHELARASRRPSAPPAPACRGRRPAAVACCRQLRDDLHQVADGNMP